jgi:hypothetical protein
MNLFLPASDVRTFANITGSTGRYSDASIGSNILAAQSFIQRETGRLFEQRDAATFTFSTDGRAQFALPDLRSATSVTLDGSALVADESYWLIPDGKQSGIYVAIQFRAFDTGDPRWYLHSSEWWDRGYDSPRPGGASGSPNDLVIVGNWGWAPAPWDVLHAVKVLASWYTKRADALLANAVANPEGAILDYSQLPPEVADCVRTYRRGQQAVAV